MNHVSTTIVHPHRLIAEAIALSLNQVPDLYVVNRVDNLEALWESIAAPELIVVDAELLKKSGYRDIGTIKSNFPNASTVVIGLVSAPEVLIAKGCAGYIDLYQGIDTAVHLITRIGRGGSGAILSSPRPPDALQLNSLSRRESQTLNLIWDGMTNKEICAYLGLKQQTVSSYVTRLCEKLDVNSRNAIVMLGRRYRDTHL